MFPKHNLTDKMKIKIAWNFVLHFFNKSNRKQRKKEKMLCVFKCTHALIHLLVLADHTRTDSHTVSFRAHVQHMQSSRKWVTPGMRQGRCHSLIKLSNTYSKRAKKKSHADISVNQACDCKDFRYASVFSHHPQNSLITDLKSALNVQYRKWVIAMHDIRKGLFRFLQIVGVSLSLVSILYAV